jgi:hypothetical protein
MNQSQSHPISFDSRSAGLAQVCLAAPATRSKAAWRYCHEGKPIAADLNRRPLAVALLTMRHAPRRCIVLQSP